MSSPVAASVDAVEMSITDNWRGSFLSSNVQRVLKRDLLALEAHGLQRAVRNHCQAFVILARLKSEGPTVFSIFESFMGGAFVPDGGLRVTVGTTQPRLTVGTAQRVTHPWLEDVLRGLRDAYPAFHMSGNTSVFLPQDA